MKVQQNYSLKNYNTFGINVNAKRFVSIDNLDDLKTILKQEATIFIISGGSNMLLTKDIKILVVHNNIKGITIVKETKNHVQLQVNAGENWHKFVQYCIKNNFGGVENLALIPGNVGTCPIQNIGAYGVEVKDTIKKINAIHLKKQKEVVFKNKDCKFGYRNSIFKNEAKGKYIITSVVFKLTKTKHKLKYNYGAIKEELILQNITKPTIKNIADTIIKIRQEKLPDPKKIGNCGSFFKNPIVDKTTFEIIYNLNPKMPFYKTENQFKIPAGWLIEQCGFKGKRFNNVGVHKKQALVLVNYGNATGKEVLTLAKKIKTEVLQKFTINLEMEVNIY